MWQKLYEELHDNNFELIAVAQDTGGEAAAGKYYDRAKATFTTLIDPQHTISSLYHMVNVPTGVWIDEDGRVVRGPEVAYAKSVRFLTIQVDGDRYVTGLRDWIDRGAQSVYALEPDEWKKRMAPRDSAAAQADANFQLGAYFHGQGDQALAVRYWQEAQRLCPDNWNYHRQAWSFTPDATALWMKKFGQLNGKAYYAPLKLPAP